MTDNPTATEKQALTEIVARAICDSIPGGYNADHRQHTIAGDPEWHLHRRSATSIKQCLEKVGYTIVPIEPTAEMCAEGFDIETERYAVHHPQEDKCADEIWAAMVAARPR